MSSKQEVVQSCDSSSCESDSSSSRESSPERAAPAPAAAPVPPAAAEPARHNKRKKTHTSHSSSKRSKIEEKEKFTKARKQKVKNDAHVLQTHAHSSSAKVTAKDIMGSDTDVDEDQQPEKKDGLVSYLCRRGSNGISKQYNPNIKGLRFVDLKLYMCSEIEKISPMNRWRHAVVTLKTKMDDDNPAYRHLTKFLKEIKHNFKDCSVTYVSTPSM